ncbi:CDP-archaeol synthase [Thiorhodococcus mannitoliphagus]|uniref:CDP-archaeol synthase n=1 Tax=Thiorhodococcus mannitoliphagus TaxID=329406 RepID=A0A6P1DNG1_9GAMM|nr:CDP-archaeol synthase [Thiorhodococcus mannitoliphagus]NEX19080.1 CDP-archaeol synthase [Thiorhodococcus mannitoliphagus]
MLAALILISWANGAPVVACLVLGRRWARPVDGGRRLGDGHLLLGRSKTWRGWAASVLTTPLVAEVLGLPWPLGLAVAVAAMLGDAAVSFLKRRLGLPSSASVFLLDQIPEALLPLLILRGPLALDSFEVLLVVLGFLVVNLVLTPAFRHLLSLRLWR